MTAARGTASRREGDLRRLNPKARSHLALGGLAEHGASPLAVGGLRGLLDLQQASGRDLPPLAAVITLHPRLQHVALLDCHLPHGCACTFDILSVIIMIDQRSKHY